MNFILKIYEIISIENRLRFHFCTAEKVFNSLWGGPPNPSTVNRGLLLDNDRTGIIVENNYIHSLVQGISIASGVHGNVSNNHIEGTQTGILVSSGSINFMGNYWDGTKNTYDIGLMSSIAGNYQVDQLSANNHNAKVQIF